jgi:RimJ/RimL family protein N-acetyltransferase
MLATPAEGMAIRRTAERPHEARAPASLDEFHAEFVAHDWCGALLGRRLPPLLSCCGTLDPRQRSAWIAGLARCWHKHGWALDRDAMCSLLDLASRWGAWPLAAEVGEALARKSLPTGVDALHLLQAWRHLGRADAALGLAVRLQLLEPGDWRYADAYSELLAWANWRDRVPRADGRDWGEADLSLEPMAHHHESDFAWQYYDPAIAQLCCLPEFDHPGEWHSWLDDVYGYGDQFVYAITHRDWGFAGSASLVVHEDVGFFYYWLGPDFQGRGLGPRAVSLLLAMARHEYALKSCYAKVFDYNLRSRRALEKLGFADLGMRGAGDDADQMFYRWGDERPRGSVIKELHWLLERMDAETRPAVPLPDAGELRI